MSKFPSPKTALIVGMSGVVLLAGAAACAGPSQPAAAPSAPATQEYDYSGNDYEPEPEPEPEPAYTCRSLVSEMTQMSEEQYTSATTLLVGIKQIDTVRDNQFNPPRNGWILECEGVAIWSGDPNSDLTFGIKAEGGQMFLSYKEQPSW